jgi:hypothetical protein
MGKGKSKKERSEKDKEQISTVAGERKTVLTAAQLASMTTHELADMLANVVLLLRRMPNVSCQELTTSATLQDEAVDTTPATSFATSLTESSSENSTSGLSEGSVQERIVELKRKTVKELQTLADDLGIPYPSKATKDVLAKRIAERQARGHSEQYAIMNL